LVVEQLVIVGEWHAYSVRWSDWIRKLNRENRSPSILEVFPGYWTSPSPKIEFKSAREILLSEPNAGSGFFSLAGGSQNKSASSSAVSCRRLESW